MPEKHSVTMASRIELWPVGRLIPYDRNSRTHSQEQIAQIAHSMITFGFTAPILVDQADGILAGHGRLKAAIQLGLPEVPVILLDHLSPEERKAYIIADNKLAENAGWDEKMLRAELADLQAADFDLEIIGFTDKELEGILDDSGEALEGETDADDAPAISVDAVSRPGDLWLLGEHRVLCGSAADAGDAARVMQNERAQLMLTDPPYNVDYTGGAGKERAPIENDSMEDGDFRALLGKAFANYRAYLRPDSSFYVFFSLSTTAAFEAMLREAGFFIRCHLIWAKNHFVLTFNRYKQCHEAILYGHLNGEVDAWYGDNAQSTVWLAPRPSANKEHPTQKPVELMEKALINSTKRGDIVMDFFGGSGSTLIACERMGRKARVIELVPNFVDVICRRWAAYTRQQPIHAEAGTTFAQIERERLLIERQIEAKPLPPLKKKRA